MHRRVSFAVISGLTLTLAAPSIAATHQEQTLNTGSEEQAEDWEPNSGTRIVCERVEEATGSRLPRTRNICLTQRQWQERRSEIYQTLENAGLRNRGNF
ncbi:MAG: hypothetical protein HKN78_09145 [Sphingomonadaceae bacterium]|nr:hypothetical protein [Sphingomonadaceae bacterium]